MEENKSTAQSLKLMTKNIYLHEKKFHNILLRKEKPSMQDIIHTVLIQTHIHTETRRLNISIKKLTWIFPYSGLKGVLFPSLGLFKDFQR